MEYDVCIWLTDFIVMEKFHEHKEEKVIGEQVIVIAMVAILMASFLYYFLKQENKLTKTGINSTAITFASKLNAIRAQWFMDKQPNVVKVREYSTGDSEQVLINIPVNKKGWVDVPFQSSKQLVIETSACQQIWHYLIDGPLKILNETIVAIEIQHNVGRSNRICRYQLPSGTYFDYSTSNGKVSEVVYSNVN